MKAIADPGDALGRGLASIRSEFQVAEAFPAPVLAAAEEASRRVPSRHVDRTGWPFVTLDPASSTDLDQAFTLERSGADLLLHYAIADVAWFVDDDDPVDREAWKRGATQYLPDGRAGLYPPVLSEGAASLLPGGPRPAVVFTVRIAPDGASSLDGAERAVIRNRAKLAYDSVRDSDLPPDFAELARRVQDAEARRGAARINPPAQEIAAIGDGGYELLFRPPLESEVRNAALSLATNLAIADLLQANRTGLFRVMAEPDTFAVERLRHTAKGLGLHWPAGIALAEFERSLLPADPRQATFMLAIRRAGQGASYVPFREGETRWHSAVAATYAHATAPLRRLADRYVVRAALALAAGEPVPPAVSDAFGRLPQVMARADALGSRIQRAAVDLAESVILNGREGETFPAIVTEVDERGARIQLCDLPVVARLGGADLEPGETLDVVLVEADTDLRTVGFRPVAERT
ncbi:MAG TPA: RNB domain-containing ribonuclease [Allosphingosinicella sp.]|jgi:exoribonuclease R|nr:RNB domain-containing ribonuclease [Allosphingosinicella sp.]